MTPRGLFSGCVGAWTLVLAATGAAACDFADAEKILQRAIDAKIFPGCAVAVGDARHILWLRGLGRLDYDHDTAATPQTLYDLASLTKVVGTTSVLVTLARDGKLHATDLVSRYVPEFVGDPNDEAQSRRRAQVTIEHLLTHSAGLPAWKPLYQTAKKYDELLAAVLRAPLESDPGKRESYSDLGVILLGELTARAGGKPLAELERVRIFEPLDMRDTLRNPSPEMLPRIAPTERRDIPLPRREGLGEGAVAMLAPAEPHDGDPPFWRGIVHDENARAGGGLTGHAGLFSTAEDLAHWAAEWLKALQGESKLFPRELAEEFIRRRNIVPGSSRALGWDTPSPGGSAGDRFSPRSFGHTGFTGTSVWIDPARGLYLILLTNAVHPERGKSGLGQVRRQLADAVVGAVSPAGN